MHHEHGVSNAIRGYQMASRAAKVLRVAQMAAMGCAVASLALGGVRAIKKFRE